jgi:hypothetical protein
MYEILDLDENTVSSPSTSEDYHHHHHHHNEGAGGGGGGNDDALQPVSQSSTDALKHVLEAMGPWMGRIESLLKPAAESDKSSVAAPNNSLASSAELLQLPSSPHVLSYEEILANLPNFADTMRRLMPRGDDESGRHVFLPSALASIASPPEFKSCPYCSLMDHVPAECPFSCVMHFDETTDIHIQHPKLANYFDSRRPTQLNAQLIETVAGILHRVQTDIWPNLVDNQQLQSRDTALSHTTRDGRPMSCLLAHQLEKGYTTEETHLQALRDYLVMKGKRGKSKKLPTWATRMTGNEGKTGVVETKKMKALDDFLPVFLLEGFFEEASMLPFFYHGMTTLRPFGVPTAYLLEVKEWSSLTGTPISAFLDMSSFLAAPDEMTRILSSCERRGFNVADMSLWRDFVHHRYSYGGDVTFAGMMTNMINALIVPPSERDASWHAVQRLSEADPDVSKRSLREKIGDTDMAYPKRLITLFDRAMRIFLEFVQNASASPHDLDRLFERARDALYELMISAPTIYRGKVHTHPPQFHSLVRLSISGSFARDALSRHRYHYVIKCPWLNHTHRRRLAIRSRSLIWIALHKPCFYELTAANSLS